jgi:hypothetical protein
MMRLLPVTNPAHVVITIGQRSRKSSATDQNLLAGSTGRVKEIISLPLPEIEVSER